MHTQLREKLGKEIRNELRHEKLNKIRKQIDNRNEELEYPLISDVLQDFWQLSHRQIAESLDVIRETVERSNIECLDEAEHNSLVVDLLYLVVEHQFELPVGLPLRKDESQMTAVLVSMTQGHTVE